MTEPLEPSAPPAETERPSYPNPKGNNINSRQLAQELSAKLTREVEVSFITAGQTDDDGNPIESVIFVTDPATGDDVPVDPAVVSNAVTAHVPAAPPPSDDDVRAEARTALVNATTLPTVKDALLKFMDTF